MDYNILNNLWAVLNFVLYFLGTSNAILAQPEDSEQPAPLTLLVSFVTLINLLVFRMWIACLNIAWIFLSMLFNLIYNAVTNHNGAWEMFLAGTKNLPDSILPIFLSLGTWLGISAILTYFSIPRVIFIPLINVLLVIPKFFQTTILIICILASCLVSFSAPSLKLWF